MIKTDFIKLYEELNELNEKALKEAVDFTNIPIKELYTSFRFNNEKEQSDTFENAAAKILERLYLMSDAEKKKLSLTWIAVGKAPKRDLKGDSLGRYKLRQDIAISIAWENVDDLKNSAELLKSDVILRLKPVDNENEEDTSLHSRLYIGGGMGSLKPYTKDINKIKKEFEKIWNPKKGNFLTRLFKKENLDSSNEELDALNEWTSRPGVYTPYIDLKIWVQTPEQFAAWKVALENKKDQLYKCISDSWNFDLVQMFSNKAKKQFTIQFAADPEYPETTDISINKFCRKYKVLDEDTIITEVGELIDQELDIEFLVEYYFFNHDAHGTRRRYVTKVDDSWEDEYYRFIDESASTLNEAKQDAINFRDFFLGNGHSEEEANGWVKRFDSIKSTLKSPENDYYYWIKKRNIKDLISLILDTERVLTVKRTKKAEVESGAELVHESEHWKIYHITNFEAAQVYGRDSKWCITGVGSYGDRYWNDYTQRGFTFYFAITKGEYDPRGTESKFAFAINHDVEYYQIFDQQDSECSLDDIPYYEEIELPGINLDYYTNEEPYYCEDCGSIVHEGEACFGVEGGTYCEDCWEKRYFYCADCGEIFRKDDGAEGDNGDYYCYDCWMSNFYECSQCWETGKIDEAQYDENGEVYCPDCYADYLEEQEDE